MSELKYICVIPDDETCIIILTALKIVFTFTTTTISKSGYDPVYCEYNSFSEDKTSMSVSVHGYKSITPAQLSKLVTQEQISTILYNEDLSEYIDSMESWWEFKSLSE